MSRRILAILPLAFVACCPSAPRGPDPARAESRVRPEQSVSCSLGEFTRRYPDARHRTVFQVQGTIAAIETCFCPSDVACEPCETLLTLESPLLDSDAKESLSLGSMGLRVRGLFAGNPVPEEFEPSLSEGAEIVLLLRVIQSFDPDTEAALEYVDHRDATVLIAD